MVRQTAAARFEPGLGFGIRALDTGGTDLVLLHIPDRLVSGVYIRANPLILI